MLLFNLNVISRAFDFENPCWFPWLSWFSIHKILHFTLVCMCKHGIKSKNTRLPPWFGQQNEPHKHPSYLVRLPLPWHKPCKPVATPPTPTSKPPQGKGHQFICTLLPQFQPPWDVLVAGLQRNPPAAFLHHRPDIKDFKLRTHGEFRRDPQALTTSFHQIP